MRVEKFPSSRRSVFITNGGRCEGASAGDLVIRFSGPPMQESEISLDDYVDTHLERLQNRYLTRLSRVSDVVLESARAQDADQERLGLLFRWFSSSIFESSLFFIEPRLMDCLRLDALEEILDGKQYQELRAIRLPRHVMSALNLTPSGMSFFRFKSLSLFSGLRARVLRQVKSAVWLLAFSFLHWQTVLLNRIPETVPPRNRVLLFTHLDSVLGSIEDYISRFWGELVAEVKKGGSVPVLVILTSRSGLKRAPFASAYSRRPSSLHFSGAGEIELVWLDAHLGLRPLSALLSVVAERRFEPQIGLALDKSFPEWQSKLLWRMFSGEHWSQRIGAKMYRDQFQSFLRWAGNSNSAIVLSEGNSWENVLLLLWKLEPRKAICGYLHTPVRLGDFRISPRKGGSTGGDSRPLQFDFYMAISRSNRAFLSEEGVSGSQIIEAVPWRYSHLQEGVAAPATAGATRILLLGDSEPGLEDEFVKLCLLLRDSLDIQFDLRYRPHPSTRLPASAKRKISGIISPESLVDDLSWASLAVCGPSSTASYDALEAGIPTVVFSPKHRIRATTNIARQKALFAHSVDEVIDSLKALIETTVDLGCDLNSRLPKGQLTRHLHRFSSAPVSEALF